jgi:mannose/fructose-specific phosphotransferase system component IIA
MKVLDKIMEMLLGMKDQIETMQGTIGEMSAKIEAMQNGEAAVFNPNGDGELFPKEFAKDKDAK